MSNIQTVIFTVGLPACGKTTWAREFMKTHKKYVRVNRDDLRNMRGEYWIPKQENMITGWESFCIEQALCSAEGLSVIVDATNLNQKFIKEKIDLIHGYRPECIIKYQDFSDIPLETCLKRDKERVNSVGEKVIMDMYNRYFRGKKEQPVRVKYNEAKDLPNAILVDLDGTLANMSNNDRSPYDSHRVGEDACHEDIARLVRREHEKGLKVVIMSGRNDSSMATSEAWLKQYNIPYDVILMRPTDNWEKDAIIKKRMFEENIRGKYYIIYALDDRDQVVKMWRHEIGLRVLQVEEGDF